MANEDKAAPAITLTLDGKRYGFKWTIESGKEFKKQTEKDLLLGHKIDLLNSKDLYFYFWAGLLCNENPELTPEYVGRQVQFLAIEMELSGKQFEFNWSLYSLHVFRTGTGLEMLQLPKHFKPDINVLSYFLFAGLSTKHKELTLEQCDRLAEMSSLLIAFKAVQAHIEAGGTAEVAGLLMKSLEAAAPTTAQKKSSMNGQRLQQKKQKTKAKPNKKKISARA